MCAEPVDTVTHKPLLLSLVNKEQHICMSDNPGISFITVLHSTVLVFFSQFALMLSLSLQGKKSLGSFFQNSHNVTFVQ